MRIHWHRRDLRLADNRGLAETPDRPVGLFVFDDSLLEQARGPRIVFLIEALGKLRAAYRARGSDLFVRHGDPAEILPECASERNAEFDSWNHDNSGVAQERDPYSVYTYFWKKWRDREKDEPRDSGGALRFRCRVYRDTRARTRRRPPDGFTRGTNGRRQNEQTPPPARSIRSSLTASAVSERSPCSNRPENKPIGPQRRRDFASSVTDID